MALITANQFVILSMKGRLGNVIVYPHPFKPGIFVMRGKGNRTRKSTPTEIQGQVKFRQASAYASAARNDSAYQSAQDCTHRSAFNLAMANYLNVPVVQDIDRSGYTGKAGETIRIQAEDDFGVVHLDVRLLALDGTVLEAGPAVQDSVGPAVWIYQAQTDIAAGQTIVIEVTAADQPGNQVMKKADHACGPRVV